MKVLVKSDVYNICNRIKKFDNSYHLVFDNVSNKYEVYTSKLSSSVELISGRVLSFVCTIPFNQLDTRVIQYLYETSIDNWQNFIAKLDEENKQIEKQNELKLKTQSMEICENKLRQLT